MKIMLCCSDGMSTSLLVSKMEEVAANKGIEAEIWAIGLGRITEYLENSPDVILLGPQIRYKLNSVKEMYKDTKVKIDAINMLDYGAMKGEKVLEHALQLIKNK